MKNVDNTNHTKCYECIADIVMMDVHGYSISLKNHSELQ
jgi:hypothetical protein